MSQDTPREGEETRLSLPEAQETADGDPPEGVYWPLFLEDVFPNARRLDRG